MNGENERARGSRFVRPKGNISEIERTSSLKAPPFIRCRIGGRYACWSSQPSSQLDLSASPSGTAMSWLFLDHERSCVTSHRARPPFTCGPLTHNAFVIHIGIWVNDGDCVIRATVRHVYVVFLLSTWTATSQTPPHRPTGLRCNSGEPRASLSTGSACCPIQRSVMHRTRNCYNATYRELSSAQLWGIRKPGSGRPLC